MEGRTKEKQTGFRREQKSNRNSIYKEDKSEIVTEFRNSKCFLKFRKKIEKGNKSKTEIILEGEQKTKKKLILKRKTVKSKNDR